MPAPISTGRSSSPASRELTAAEISTRARLLADPRALIDTPGRCIGCAARETRSLWCSGCWSVAEASGILPDATAAYRSARRAGIEPPETPALFRSVNGRGR